MRFLPRGPLGGIPPSNPSCTISPYPFFPPFVPLASHPSDLKYVDTLARTHIHTRAHVTREWTRPYVHGVTVASRTLSSHLPPTEYTRASRASPPPSSSSLPTIPHPCAHGLYSSARFDIFRELRPARTWWKSILRADSPPAPTLFLSPPYLCAPLSLPLDPGRARFFPSSFFLRFFASRLFLP